MAPTYGVAEQAAEIIRAQYNNVPPPGASVTMSSTSSTSTSATTATSNFPPKSSHKSGAAPPRLTAVSGLLETAIGAVLLGIIYSFA